MTRSTNIVALILAIAIVAILASYVVYAISQKCTCTASKGSTLPFHIHNFTHIWKHRWRFGNWTEHNATEIAREAVKHIEKVIESKVRHARKIIENVTELVDIIKNYTNASVIFRHGVKCRKVKLLLKKAILLFNESSEIVESILEAVNSTFACRGKCVLKHVLAVLNNTEIIAEELVLENTTFRCHNCTIVGKIVFGNSSKVHLVNPNMTMAYALCNHCKYILSRYITKRVNVTMNHTKTWLMLGRENPLLHNHTIYIEVQTPGVNITISIVTRWCIDNYTVVAVPECITNKCRLRLMNYLTCRPKITINVVNRVVNVTIYHGVYDTRHAILLAVNSSNIVTYGIRPLPGVVATLIVNSSSGEVSTIMLTNVTKPIAVGYVPLKITNTTINVKNATLIPYVDPETFTKCKLCWTYLNESKILLIHVIHHSPVGIVVLTSEKELLLGFTLPLVILFIVLIAALAVIAYIAIKLGKVSKRLQKYIRR